MVYSCSVFTNLLKLSLKKLTKIGGLSEIMNKSSMLLLSTYRTLTIDIQFYLQISMQGHHRWHQCVAGAWL